MLKKIYNIVTTAVVVVVVVLAILLGGLRIIGFIPFTVLTSSMTPTYYPGDLVYVEKKDIDEIKIGDALTFTISDNKVVTHRVDGIDKEKGCFYTKGDANSSRDTAPVLFENVIGTVAFSIPKLGYLSNYIASTDGKYIIFMALGVLVLLFLLPEFFKKKPEKKSDKEIKKTE